MKSGPQLFGLLACGLMFVVLAVDVADAAAGWSPWSMYASPCNKTCGGGQQKRVRTCSMPAPTSTSDICVGSNYQIIDCNVDSCQTGWSSWSPCSKSCDYGVSKRWVIAKMQISVGLSIIIFFLHFLRKTISFLFPKNFPIYCLIVLNVAWYRTLLVVT
jgi:hypothetical protein